jgi:hypothetical protein
MKSHILPILKKYNNSNNLTSVKESVGKAKPMAGAEEKKVDLGEDEKAEVYLGEEDKSKVDLGEDCTDEPLMPSPEEQVQFI